MTIARTTTLAAARARAGAQRGYTLLEILVVVAVMGIAGAMVIPSMDQAGVLRTQGAVRSVVSDIMFAQGDAVAAQQARAVVFDTATNSYRVCAVLGSTIDIDNDVLFDHYGGGNRYIVDLDQAEFGTSFITGATFDGTGNVLVFDEMGAPVIAVGESTPSSGGNVTIRGQFHNFVVRVESFTGRVTTTRTLIGEDEPEEEEPVEEPVE